MRRLPLALVVVLAAAVPACSGSSKAATPSASVTSPPTTTATTSTTLTVEQQVEAAYLHSWDVYAKAVRTLDPSGLSESYTGGQLETTTQEIRDRIAEHRPGAVSVEHHISVKVIDQLTAVVRDAYVNHSVRLDPTTGQPAERDPNETLSDTYTMKLTEGTWKVSFIVRQR